MSIETRRYRLIEKVMQLNESQLKKVEDVLGEDSELETKLDKAMQQVKDGKVRPHSEVRKKYEKWL